MSTPYPTERRFGRKRDGRPFLVRAGDGRGDAAPADLPVIYAAELDALGALDDVTQDAVFDAKDVFGPGTRLVTAADIPPPLPLTPAPLPRAPGRRTARSEEPSGELWPPGRRPRAQPAGAAGADEGAPVGPSHPTGAHGRDGRDGV
jgi:hypothetical protein